MKALLTISAALFFSHIVSAGTLMDSIGYFLKDGDTIVIYEVGRGETVSSIARKYDITLAHIAGYNPGVDIDKLRDGQILKVPGARLRVHLRAQDNEAARIAAIADREREKAERKSAMGKETQNPIFASDAKEQYDEYKVQLGETLFAIARKLGVEVNDILNANPGLDPDRIREGQVLRIPMKAKTPEQVTTGGQNETLRAVIEHPPQKVETREPEKEDPISKKHDSSPNLKSKPEPQRAPETPQISTTTSNGFIQHTVKQGETMYSISRQYQVKVTDLMEWNGLSSFEIKEGQILQIKGTVQETAISAPVTSAPVTEPAAPDVNVSASQDNAPAAERERSSYFEYAGRENILSLQYKEDLSSAYFKESRQNGVTAWIADVGGYPVESGYFALHKTLPIGTVIKVRNLMNDRIIFAKVIGRLPDSAANEKLLLKLPDSARQSLRVLDDQAAVEVSYLERK
jgi:LysM repeat protein